VKFAARVALVSGKEPPEGVAADFTITHEVPPSQMGSHKASRSSDSRLNETGSTEPQVISAGSTNQSALNGVLSAKVSLSRLSAPVSKRVSGGNCCATFCRRILSRPACCADHESEPLTKIRRFVLKVGKSPFRAISRALSHSR
jgi:hypothetical protein